MDLIDEIEIFFFLFLFFGQCTPLYYNHLVSGIHSYYERKINKDECDVEVVIRIVLLSNHNDF